MGNEQDSRRQPNPREVAVGKLEKHRRIPVRASNLWRPRGFVLMMGCSLAEGEPVPDLRGGADALRPFGNRQEEATRDHDGDG